jgi:hypothetical protein
MFKIAYNYLSFCRKLKELVFPYIYHNIMPAECLGVSLGVLAGTLGVLGVLWYTERRNNDKNPIIKKRQNREVLNEHTLTN